MAVKFKTRGLLFSSTSGTDNILHTSTKFLIIATLSHWTNECNIEKHLCALRIPYGSIFASSFLNKNGNKFVFVFIFLIFLLFISKCRTMIGILTVYFRWTMISWTISMTWLIWIWIRGPMRTITCRHQHRPALNRKMIMICLAWNRLPIKCWAHHKTWFRAHHQTAAYLVTMLICKYCITMTYAYTIHAITKETIVIQCVL